MKIVRPHLGGVATIHCVHDRQKRQVTDPEQVAFLGRAVGQTYNPRRHKLIRCACCENLFVSNDDTPKLCQVCVGAASHRLEAPLPEPEGAFDG
jgi:hypothetical protein